MSKIVFFDIDGTLFNVKSFLALFHQKLINELGFSNSQISNLKDLYEETKKEAGYFLPSLFISKISEAFSLKTDELTRLFNSIDLFDKSVYKDSPGIKSLAVKANIGIFSEGDNQFQRKKITFLGSLINEEDIYIFPDKLKMAGQVFSKYEGFEIYLIDNNIKVLREVEKINSKINLILINREEDLAENDEIISIKNLGEINAVI